MLQLQFWQYFACDISKSNPQNNSIAIEKITSTYTDFFGQVVGSTRQIHLLDNSRFTANNQSETLRIFPRIDDQILKI